MNWYIAALKKYSVFQGRARRKEFWYFFLFYFFYYFILAYIDNVTGSYDPQEGVGFLTSIYLIAMIIPSIAVYIGRLHDINRSGKWFFLNFFPIIGNVLLLYFASQDSYPGNNKYGPNPKHSSS